MTDFLTLFIPALATVVVAIIEAQASKDRKAAEKRDAETKERAARRKKESILSMKMMFAALQLSEVSARALTGGHNNGNVEEAMEEAKQAREEYQNFLQSTAAEELV